MDLFMTVDDVAKELGISKSYAYKVVQRLNEELKEKGYLTISKGLPDDLRSGQSYVFHGEILL